VVPPPPPPHKQIKNYNDLFIVLRKLTRFLKKSKQMWGYSPIFIIVFFYKFGYYQSLQSVLFEFYFSNNKFKILQCFSGSGN